MTTITILYFLFLSPLSCNFLHIVHTQKPRPSSLDRPVILSFFPGLACSMRPYQRPSLPFYLPSPFPCHHLSFLRVSAISTDSLFLLTSSPLFTSLSTSASFCMSAGMAMQEPEPSSLSSLAVASQSFADRELM